VVENTAVTLYTTDPIHANEIAEYIIQLRTFFYTTDFQVAFNGDCGKVDYRSNVSNPNKGIADKQRTEPV